MNRTELDADIARMLAVHRNRKTLGFSYYQTSGRRQRTQKDPVAERKDAAERKRTSRARAR